MQKIQSRVSMCTIYDHKTHLLLNAGIGIQKAKLISAAGQLLFDIFGSKKQHVVFVRQGHRNANNFHLNIQNGT